MIEAMRGIAEEMKPITGRGIGYKLFTRKLIADMGKGSMSKVYRNLVTAREQGTIPWPWIIDESREPEGVSTWENPDHVADNFFYRRELWQTQPKRVEVWSEKGTVRGVIWPVLARFGVKFQVLHGFNSATCMWNVSQQDDTDDRPLVALYIGDRDPSGLNMSESDIPARLARYGGDHVEFRRIALTAEHTRSLTPFSVEDKKKDPRYKWFKQHYGNECWELDAMDPRQLRDLVETEIDALIDPDLWEEQEELQKREKESAELHLRRWAKFESLEDIERQRAEVQLRWWSLYESMKAAA